MSDIVEQFCVNRIEQVQEAVLGAQRIVARGGGSKPALSDAPPGALALDLRCLSGIVDYRPAEFTFTALAGTPLSEIAQALAAHNQYLAFDPPLVEQGATLGGAIAAGLNGPQRYRYGGLRDFLIGVRFVDGQGRLVRGGGKVVKNAAGFDLPKLMAGSLGRLGILVEATFKVFPRPESTASLRVERASMDDAASLLRRLATTALDIEAIDVVAGEQPAVWIRLGGRPALLAERLERLRVLAGDGMAVSDDEDDRFWAGQRAFVWAPAEWALVKTPTNPHRLHALDVALAEIGALRRYSVGGHLAWFAAARPAGEISDLLTALGASGLLLRGQNASPWLGVRTGVDVIQRVKGVLDPHARFLEY